MQEKERVQAAEGEERWKAIEELVVEMNAEVKDIEESL